MLVRGKVMSKNILIVEDNDNNRILLRDIILFHGYNAVEAVNGTEGVMKAKDLHPDLILMDIQMPGKDGFEAIMELKQDPETADIIIIALTSFAMKGDRERIMAAGFDDYLAKPIDTRKLPQLIEKHITAKARV
jgi:two-component system cell cycle response regulator DivK